MRLWRNFYFLDLWPYDKKIPGRKEKKTLLPRAAAAVPTFSDKKGRKRSGKSGLKVWQKPICRGEDGSGTWIFRGKTFLCLSRPWTKKLFSFCGHVTLSPSANNSSFNTEILKGSLWTLHKKPVPSFLKKKSLLKFNVRWKLTAGKKSRSISLVPTASSHSFQIISSGTRKPRVIHCGERDSEPGS